MVLAGEDGYAERAADLFHRDGFVSQPCPQSLLAPAGPRTHLCCLYSGLTRATTAARCRQVCVSGVLTPSHVAALRARTDSCMRSALALDQHQGAKGAWRYMFSTGEKTGTCMHYPVRPNHRRFPSPKVVS